MPACPRSTSGVHARENRRVPERMKVRISLGVIVASVTLFLWRPFRSMHVVDGMPDGGSDPAWPIWLGLAGIAAGIALLLFWGRRRPSRRSNPADD
jgi:LPXTG-motif cell wall-anchored protein